MSAGNLVVAALKFADARVLYQQVISLYPASTLIPDCTYQPGLTDYDEKRYAESLPLFQTVFTNYPNSTVADGALDPRTCTGCHAGLFLCAGTCCVRRDDDELPSQQLDR